MPTKSNITVAIEPSVLKKARAIAAGRGRSVSALLADHLREDVVFVDSTQRLSQDLNAGQMIVGIRILNPLMIA